MKNIINSLIKLTFLIVLVVFGACRTWDEDFNTNKNKPQITEGSAVPPKFFVGPMIHAIERNYETVMNNMNAVAEYHGKLRSLSQGNRHRSWHDFDGNVWGPIYSSISQVKNVRRGGIALEDDRYVAVADIWECYVMYNMTSMSGPIPYFDVISDEGEVKYLISYDPQEEIYPAILAKLKEAGLMLSGNEDPIDEKSDYVYGGDMMKWKKLANTLRLRMALYMYNAAPQESAAIMEEIISDPATYPVFQSNDDNFKVHYDGVTRLSRWFTYTSLPRNHHPSNILVERLISLKDPRLYRYAKPVQKLHDDPELWVLPSNPGPDKYVGQIYGLTTSNGHAVSWNGGREYTSRIGDWFMILDENDVISSEMADKPQTLATYAEMNFILAEIKERGIINSGKTAQEYYEEGIKASFARYECGFSGNELYDGAYGTEGLTDVDAYLAQQQVNWSGGRDHLVLIAEQKWISLLWVGFECYLDHRRSMLPDMRASHRAANYESSGSGTAFPSRSAYPSSEAAENTLAWETARATGFDIPITGDDNRNEARMWILTNGPSLEMTTFQEPLIDNEEYPGQANFKTWYDTHWKSMFWWENE